MKQWSEQTNTPSVAALLRRGKEQQRKDKRVSQRGFLAAGLLLRKKIWETKKKFRQSSNQKTEEQTGLRKDSQFWTSLDIIKTIQKWGICTNVDIAKTILSYFGQNWI